MVSYAQLVDYFSLSEAELGKGCSDDVLLKISINFTNWRSAAPHLELKDADVDAVDKDCHSEEEKHYKILKRWKAKFGFLATYEKLMKGFLGAGRVDLAQQVAEELKKNRGPENTPSGGGGESGGGERGAVKPPNGGDKRDFTKFGKPDLTSLMNLVGVTVKNKWRGIGGGLGVKSTDLDSFQTEEASKPDATQNCMRRVFEKWQSAMTSDYTWQNLVAVLESPAVDMKDAAKELYKSLCEKYN